MLRDIEIANPLSKEFRERFERAVTQNPFNGVEVVTLELSNYCPMAHLHKVCPASLATEVKVLSWHLVSIVFAELSRWNYMGIVNLHRYNEPMADPRLFLFIDELRRHVPMCIPAISTNGQFLNQEVIHDLVRVGLQRLHVSLYGTLNTRHRMRRDVERWTEMYPDLEVILPDPRNTPLIKDFLEIYETKILDLDRPCGAPLRQINISCGGDVVLCCRDWKNQNTFGNIARRNLKSIIEDDLFQETHRRLSVGDRSVTELCRRCNTAR